MLSFLLDENISTVVAVQLRAKRPDIPVISLSEWQGGMYLGVDEATWLAAAGDENLTLVTFDRKTVEPLLKQFGDTEQSHSGVVLIDERSIMQFDYGAQIRALISLWDARGAESWQNVVIYLGNELGI